MAPTRAGGQRAAASGAHGTAGLWGTPGKADPTDDPIHLQPQMVDDDREWRGQHHLSGFCSICPIFTIYSHIPCRNMNYVRLQKGMIALVLLFSKLLKPLGTSNVKPYGCEHPSRG